MVFCDLSFDCCRFRCENELFVLFDYLSMELILFNL